jgi:hypothetical protein
MPTEDDLRAALTSLERHAPAAARVLAGLDGRRPRRRPRSPKAVGWLAGIAAAAALAGAVTAVTVTGGASRTSSPNGSVASQSGATNLVALQAKLLAALSSNSDMVYEQGYTTNTGDAPIVQEFWYYPGQPAAGQQVRTRSLTYSTDGKLHQDVEEIYAMPASSSKCGATPDLVAQGERISVDYVAKTWSDLKPARLLIEPTQSPAQLVKDTPTEHWTVLHTTLDGRAALELTAKGAAGDNSWDDNLWFDASTYLPLREVTSFGPKNIRTSATFDYQYLPATPANLAKLTPPNPAGFRQVAGEQVPETSPCFGSETVGPSPSPKVITLAPSPTSSR